ncbi:GGDEF domain-containing protein [Pelomonas sp. SE-A7]|uniref:GGDEF domain-containing protein n=1 Tax=Pelomonas sp. SE-A7 TaxID=3054953 RepID=UPI00259CAA09|nr:GGDEF domain-containing protein [Pelomonas sp. SE-A7]MDM4767821.1 GGDEF domain-containing protein [Pelomonas sp. SE-A7]
MLHESTLLLVEVLFTLLTTGLLVIAALMIGRHAELRSWALGNVVACLGLAVGIQTGLPVFFHAVLGYGFMGLGQALVWRGLRRFCGLELSRISIAAITLAAMALPAYFVWAEPSLNGRLIVTGFGFGLLSLVCAVTLVQGVRDRIRPVMWVSAGGFVVLGLVLMMRALWLLLFGSEQADQELVMNATLFMIPPAQVCIAFGLVLMITRRYAEELRRLSLTDRVTGAYNRAGLDSLGQRMLQRARRSGRGVVLVLIEVDHFDHITSNFGPGAGDEVLRQLATLLLAQLRPGDMVVRYGGEEFLVLLDGVDAGIAAKVCERVRKQVVESRIQLPNAELNYTTSLGLAGSEARGHELERLVESADAALQKAKLDGGNRVLAG